MKNIISLIAIIVFLASCKDQKSNIEHQTSPVHEEAEGKVELTKDQIKSADIQFGKIEIKRKHIVLNNFDYFL